eukprot:TRINITY_DN65700_c2_g1_i2.p1 TRINITY_DN65700_c2_g1~~TRINITY_DN65700_c2_g1_i2.p1  ORF type:complete len:218 (+),score=105.40 TRINITY_DN65700_c2_g1_i2:572-1225(+)
MEKSELQAELRKMSHDTMALENRMLALKRENKKLQAALELRTSVLAQQQQQQQQQQDRGQSRRSSVYSVTRTHERGSSARSTPKMLSPTNASPLRSPLNNGHSAVSSPSQHGPEHHATRADLSRRGVGLKRRLSKKQVEQKSKELRERPPFSSAVATGTHRVTSRPASGVIHLVPTTTSSKATAFTFTSSETNTPSSTVPVIHIDLTTILQPADMKK